MAEQSASERTEQATPERVRRAREDGRVPQSREVPSALIITGLLLMLALMAGGLLRHFTSLVETGLSLPADRVVHGGGVTGVLRALATQSLRTLAPLFFAALALSVLASLVASGWAFAPKAASPRFERINPANGLKTLFSLRSLVHLLVSVAKLGVILAICWSYLDSKLSHCLSLRWMTPVGTLVGISRLVFGLVGRIAIGLLAIAGLDLLYQRWHYRKQLRMTRQEVKEERKEHELSGEVRGRIRTVQMEMARKRMLQAVPTADVVVTNPTHVAVALRYDSQTMEAPEVVAKGGDLLCEKIKEIARAHDVPVVQRPELARTLYSVVEVGRTIPEALFVAVAELLAMIYRMRKRRKKV